jgi:hypothetical protein
MNTSWRFAEIGTGITHREWARPGILFQTLNKGVESNIFCFADKPDSGLVAFTFSE